MKCREVRAVGVEDVVDPAKLRRQLLLRGWTQRDLAHHSGVSQTTISGVFRTAHVHPRTLECLALTFQAHPPTNGVEELLVAEAAG
jgi:transcriptional regulator with XRE-family HTH domain